MNHVTWKILLFVLLVQSVIPNNVWSQEPLKKVDIEEEFEKAMAYLYSFKNDSANIILSQLMVELAAKNELETSFGLNVQLRQAEVLEKDNQDEAAIQKLLHVAEVSQQKEEWSVFSHAQLSLARLHEKIGREENCLASLMQVESAINEHKLNDIYPRFALRMSSYYRIFSDVDSALYFAKEVIRTAPEFGLFEDKATGHLLAGMLLSDSDYQASAQHLKAAGKTYKSLDNYSGYGAVLSNLSRLHLKNDNTQLALYYNDSSLVAAGIAATMGNEEPWMYYVNYQDRANIYKAIGQHDSAWHYLSLGHEMELEDIYKYNNEKVIEIEERYKDEKKAQKIEEQSQLITYQKERRNYTLGFFVFVLLFASILAYYYFRLRKANQKTQAQSQIIKKTNEDLADSLQQQILLQGEIHHRVKNNLQVIISLLELQIDDIDDSEAKVNLETMCNRIYSMAAIHEMLYQKEGTETIDLLEYTETLCNHFSNFSRKDEKPIFQLNLKNQNFNLSTLMPLGIILSELLTNSIKYAKNNIGKKLTIGIGLQQTNDGFCMSYRDNGPGFPEGILVEREGGLGTYLLKSMSRQLNGYLESKNDNGAVCNIFFKEKNKGIAYE